MQLPLLHNISRPVYHVPEKYRATFSWVSTSLVLSRGMLLLCHTVVSFKKAPKTPNRAEDNAPLGRGSEVKSKARRGGQGLLSRCRRSLEIPNHHVRTCCCMQGVGRYSVVAYPVTTRFIVAMTSYENGDNNNNPRVCIIFKPRT